VSRLDLTLGPKVAVGRRGRRWPGDEKARAIEESFAPGAVVSEVARRHGLTAQQLFRWRREARGKARQYTEAPAFVPAVVSTTAAPGSAPAMTRGSETNAAPVVEIEIGGAHVWIWSSADVGMATAILRSLQKDPDAK